MEEKVIMEADVKEETKPALVKFSGSVLKHNLKEIKENVVKLNEFYKGLVYTEEQIEEAKNEVKTINNFKKEFSTQRKEIYNKYVEPAEPFKNDSIAIEKLLDDTKNTIDFQVKKFEQDTINERVEKLKTWFKEYCIDINVNIVEFDKIPLNFTMSNTKGNTLRKEIITFMERIQNDLKLINFEEHKEEILVEYTNNGFNYSNAKIDVLTRLQRLEEMKQKQEEQNKRLEEQLKREEENKQFIEEEIEIEEPIEVEEEIIEQNVQIEKEYEVNFKVKTTMENLKKLAKFLESEGIKYEQQ